jgi:dienelactone hydrolase
MLRAAQKFSSAPVFALALLGLAPALHAEIVTQTVEYDVEGTTHIGYLAYDDAIEELQPGVLVIHEWWGLNDFARERARAVAELGYVAFAPDMYGEGRVTRDPEQAGERSSAVEEQQRFETLGKAALQVLRAQDRVDEERLASMGFCFGGTSTLAMAFAGLPLDAAISFHGHLPVPDRQALDHTEADLLILHGAADPYVEPALVTRFRDALLASRLDWQLVWFGNVQHSFMNPAAEESGLDGLAYDPRAAHRAWQQTGDFLAQSLR